MQASFDHDPSSQEAFRRLSPDSDSRGWLIWRVLLGLRARTGIAPTTAMADKLTARFRDTGTSELATIVTDLEQLSAKHSAWLELIGALTVHETVFMRDPAQMAMFAKDVLPNVIAEAAQRDRCLIFGSAGCSTGEEAYSIAMLTVEALVAAGEVAEHVAGITWRRPWSIRIVGSDISPAVLQHARQAIYATGEFSSFRGLPDRFLRFLPMIEGGSFRGVHRDLRQMVRFEHCNLSESPPPGGPFDVLFCRNVLIYFASEAKRFAIGALGASLKPAGWLLLGSTDRPGDAAFVTAIWGEGAVAYRRKLPP